VQLLHAQWDSEEVRPRAPTTDGWPELGIVTSEVSARVRALATAWPFCNASKRAWVTGCIVAKMSRSLHGV
jgi:hypothetical protein